MIHFIGDLHFGDENILRYDRRPFKNVREMDTKLIENWREMISPNDEVYVTGDFGAEGYESDILKELTGTVHLIKGNHDVHENTYYRKAGFAEVYNHPIILEGFWIVSHEPMYVSEHMPYANIFAHVHGNPMYNTVSCRSYCTSVDRNGYRPVSFDTVKTQVAAADSEITCNYSDLSV